ncbi:MAG: LCP family protein [Nocardioidaceae bacterium]
MFETICLVADDETPPAESPAPPAPRMEQRHRRTVLRVIVASQLALALVTALVVLLAFNNLNGNITVDDFEQQLTDRPEKIDVAGPQEPLNILVMGSDSREGEGNNIDGLTGGGERSDTTILIHVSADREDAYGVSLPRDALVDRPDCMNADLETIPGEKLTMFNTAFSVGGPACTIQTVEQLTGIRIDHHITVDFNGFKDMVDAVRGVEVCIPRDVEDYEHDIFFEAGTQSLTGQQALNYVRERTVLSVTGDIGRMKRQQAFIASMINKVMSANTLTRPERVYEFLYAATSSIRLDKELGSLGKLADLAMQFQATGLADIKFVTVPFEPYAPDPNRLVWTAEAETLWERIRNDEPLGRMLSQDSLSAADPVGSPTGTRPGSKNSAEKDAAQRLANGLCA